MARDAWMDIAWSPDGREIAFLGGGIENAGLYVLKADGSGQRRLTRNAQASGFGWAPDGQTIAFTRVRGGYRDVYVMNADGSGQRRLVQRGIRPRWAPDGQLISFMSRRDDNWEIYVMNADGSGVRNVTRSAPDEHTVTWSPDGRKIAYSSSADIYVMNADGTGQRRLARNAGWLAWSPPQKK